MCVCIFKSLGETFQAFCTHMYTYTYKYIFTVFSNSKICCRYPNLSVYQNISCLKMAVQWSINTPGVYHGKWKFCTCLETKNFAKH